MTRIEEIQHLIRGLSRNEREELAEWILNLGNFPLGVAEAALPYEQQPSRFMTHDEYMRTEEVSEIRQEYLAGEIFALCGVSIRHANISGTLLTRLGEHFRGGPCRAFHGNVKVALRVDRADVYYYPDIAVTCSPQNPDEYFLADPRLIVEITSPSTEHIDRREKRLNYPLIPTVEEYVVIAQRSPQVMIHRRAEDWRPQELTSLTDIAEFRSIDFRLSLEELYRPVYPSRSDAHESI